MDKVHVLCPVNSNNSYNGQSDTRKPMKTNNGQINFLAANCLDDDNQCKSNQPSSSKKRPSSMAIKKMPPKRKKSSDKERQRNLEIKEALVVLSKSVPYVNKDLSRIRTLRLAKEYINHLRRILQGETVTCDYSGSQRPLTMNDFERVVNQEMQTNNSYKDRADEELSTGGTNSYSNSPAPTRDSPKSQSEKENTKKEKQMDMLPGQSEPNYCLNSFLTTVNPERDNNNNQTDIFKNVYTSQQVYSHLAHYNPLCSYDFQDNRNFY
uniref:BHLH domain-containing protein n=1 Tax=Ditylenchus dipsaci TaxID=166011 RepID=A0A915DQE1_9BILA